MYFAIALTCFAVKIQIIYRIYAANIGFFHRNGASRKAYDIG
jgi:hypothetical protein